jgi:hypothetical protein
MRDRPCAYGRTARCWRPFDLRRHQFTGNPVSIMIESGLSPPAWPSSRFRDLLAYHGGPTLSELLWVDRTGRQVGTLGARGSYHDVRISRNGREVAVVAVDPRTGSSDISIFDRDSGIPTRFTSSAGGATRPVWSAGGDLLFYRVAGASPRHL